MAFRLLYLDSLHSGLSGSMLLTDFMSVSFAGRALCVLISKLGIWTTDWEINFTLL